MVRSVSTSPGVEDHNLSVVRDCLFKIFAATLHIWRPFLHPQPEDAPCRGDRDPLITEFVAPKIGIFFSLGQAWRKFLSAHAQVADYFRRDSFESEHISFPAATCFRLF